MHNRRLAIAFALLLCAAIPAVGKEGVRATVYTSLSEAVAGSRVDVSWSLEVEKTGEAFTACRLFVRLIGPSGRWTEAFAPCLPGDDGRYRATATIPAGGVASVEIGIAGNVTDEHGRKHRSDWLIPLANDPLHGP